MAFKLIQPWTIKRLYMNISRRDFHAFSSLNTYIPFVTENDGRSIVNYDIYSRLLKDRIVILNGQIEGNIASSIVAQLLFLEAESPDKPISMYINSPGGEVTAGLAIYDTMQYIKSPVSTLCIGQAASAASLLLTAGAQGQRFALPNCSIMVHQPSGGFQGQASDIAIHARQILDLRMRINGLYQKHITTDKSLEQIESIMERDKFMTAEEAKEFGIVDQVLQNRSQSEL